jgi:hypothetical protein
MIHKQDEFLHELKPKKEWIESFSINFNCKKNRVYGSADIVYQFNKNIVEIDWLIIYNSRIYESSTSIEFNGKLAAKKVSGPGFEYSIISPLEKLKLTLKNEKITANINISGICPVYQFPENIIDDDAEESRTGVPKTWEKYEQRCKITGDISVKAGEDKGKKTNFVCFGQREHLWGSITSLKSYSRVSVQFRDMAMVLTYTEKGPRPESNGYISKRSGNIPVINVECESLTINKTSDIISSSEFSYTDAQDDVDLLVGSSIFSIPMPLPPAKRKKFLRFRNFSEYTIIGTNKKGIGVEDHYFSREMLKLFRNPD